MTDVYENILYPWLNGLVETGLAEWEEELADSAVMDYLRWGRVNAKDAEGAVLPDGASNGAAQADTSSLIQRARQAYQEQVEQVRSFLAVRKEFLYGEWIGCTDGAS